MNGNTNLSAIDILESSSIFMDLLSRQREIYSSSGIHSWLSQEKLQRNLHQHFCLPIYGHHLNMAKPQRTDLPHADHDQGDSIISEFYSSFSLYTLHSDSTSYKPLKYSKAIYFLHIFLSKLNQTSLQFSVVIIIRLNSYLKHLLI